MGAKYRQRNPIEMILYVASGHLNDRALIPCGYATIPVFWHHLGVARKQMASLLAKLKHYFDPPQDGNIEFEYYIRTGECHQCGSCCSGIYLVRGNKPIQTIEQFNDLKGRYEDYSHFVPQQEDATGVLFRCQHLTEDKRCGIYENRPRFCRKYPSEDVLLLGAQLAPQCGFTFKAKHHFNELLAQAAQKKQLKPGKLVNDPPTSPMPSVPRLAD